MDCRDDGDRSGRKEGKEVWIDFVRYDTHERFFGSALGVE